MPLRGAGTDGRGRALGRQRARLVAAAQRVRARVDARHVVAGTPHARHLRVAAPLERAVEARVHVPHRDCRVLQHLPARARAAEPRRSRPAAVAAAAAAARRVGGRASGGWHDGAPCGKARLPYGRAGGRARAAGGRAGAPRFRSPRERRPLPARAPAAPPAPPPSPPPRPGCRPAPLRQCVPRSGAAAQPLGEQQQRRRCSCCASSSPATPAARHAAAARGARWRRLQRRRRRRRAGGGCERAAAAVAAAAAEARGRRRSASTRGEAQAAC